MIHEILYLQGEVFSCALLAPIEGFQRKHSLEKYSIRFQKTSHREGFNPGQALHVHREIPKSLFEQCIQVIPTAEVGDIHLKKEFNRPMWGKYHVGNVVLWRPRWRTKLQSS
jgi:hypothetical protein